MDSSNMYVSCKSGGIFKEWKLRMRIILNGENISVLWLCAKTPFLAPHIPRIKTRKQQKSCVHISVVFWLRTYLFIWWCVFQERKPELKKQNKTCVHNCVVNPQRNLVKLNTQNGIGLNVFFLVGTICKHQNT